MMSLSAGAPSRDVPVVDVDAGLFQRLGLPVDLEQLGVVARVEAERSGEVEPQLEHLERSAELGWVKEG